MSAEPGVQTYKTTQTASQVGVLTILALGLMMAFGPLSMDMYLPAFPAIEQEFKATASVVQLSLTACMVGLALGQLIAGPVSDQLGRRGPLIVGLSAYVVSSLLCVWIPSIEAFIVLRFIQGLSGAAGIVIARAITRDMFSGHELTRFTATLTIVFGAAPILGPVIGGQLLRFMSWHGLFYILAGIGAFLILYVLFGMEETLPKEKRIKGGFRQTFKNFATLLGDRFFLGLALTQGFAAACMFIYIASSSFVLQNNYGISPFLYGFIFGTNALGNIILAQITGRLAGRVSERRMYTTGVLISATGGSLVLLAAITHAGLWLLLIGFFMCVSSLGIIHTVNFSLALTKYGHAAGTASGIIGVLSFFIGGLLAPISGLGGSEAELPMGIMMALTSWTAVTIFFVLVRRNMGKGNN